MAFHLLSSIACMIWHNQEHYLVVRYNICHGYPVQTANLTSPPKSISFLTFLYALALLISFWTGCWWPNHWANHCGGFGLDFYRAFSSSCSLSSIYLSLHLSL
ncbi:unnamed protein product [Chondrus crispus]|uniref:Uncharacterized protein n=1 Tax=Chondrus crispus TaxID=2769 RepID=R7QRR9_CHOCR|nr:unnamed protein product [Chondrus crispus]CDF41192.1 unnamed protein product [Chondrus crispus]|eukprot:XP_005711486.1 unnamed protein product [Chondrus crispus]